jgi:hypothetical protein
VFASVAPRSYLPANPVEGRSELFSNNPQPSTLNLNMVPALILTGAAGSSWRIDYINQAGPIDAWVNLATVTLTNTSQLYFDTSVIGQPPRLWRIVPVP